MLIFFHRLSTVFRFLKDPSSIDRNPVAKHLLMITTIPLFNDHYYTSAHWLVVSTLVFISTDVVFESMTLCYKFSPLAEFHQFIYLKEI